MVLSMLGSKWDNFETNLSNFTSIVSPNSGLYQLFSHNFSSRLLLKHFLPTVKKNYYVLGGYKTISKQISQNSKQLNIYLIQ